MKKTRLSLFYLGSYLTIIGLSLLLAPHDTLKLLLSNGDYGDVFPRVAGMLMSGMGLSVLGMIRAHASDLYPATAANAGVFYRLHCHVLCDDLRPLLLGSDNHCQDRVCANPKRVPSRSTSTRERLAKQ
jgi:hypothetical protein